LRDTNQRIEKTYAKRRREPNKTVGGGYAHKTGGHHSNFQEKPKYMEKMLKEKEGGARGRTPAIRRNLPNGQIKGHENERRHISANIFRPKEPRRRRL